MSQPRILITRSPHQASELADRLRALDLEPILVPTIDLAEPTTFATLDAALAGLIAPGPHQGGEPAAAGQPVFHWLLFTSANAVEAFHHRVTVLKGTAFSPSISPALKGTGFSPSISEAGQEGASVPEGNLHAGLKIAAIGPATARALEAIGLQPDLIPPQAIAESFAESLLPHAKQPNGTPTRFLLIRAEAARDHLPDTLRAAGAEVTIAAAYRTVIPAESVARIKQLFEDRQTWPSAILFTSSSTATNLQALLEVSGLAFPPQILRISIGPITSQTLRDLDLPPHAQAEQPTLSALAAAVVKALDREKTPNPLK